MPFRKVAFYLIASVSLLLSGSPLLAASADQNAGWDAVKSLPDWAGVWASTNLSNRDIGKAHLTPLGTAHMAELKKLRETNGDVPSRSKHCQMSGFPGGMSGPEEYTEEFLFTPGQVTMTQVQGFVR